MLRQTVNALVACLMTFLICAVAYPAAVWGLGQLLFPSQAEGSLVYDRDRTLIGSELIAQPFVSDKYFFPRPSAVDYKADATGGSNLGTKNPDLRKKVVERAEALKAGKENPAPVDLISASGGGIDPHITPEAAYYQVARVAAARKMPGRQVRSLVDRHVETSGEIIGAPPRVNVLRLNLDLDAEKPAHADAASDESPGVPNSTSGAAGLLISSHTDPTPTPAAGPASDPRAIRNQAGELAGAVGRLTKQAEAVSLSEAAQEKTRQEFKIIQERLNEISDGAEKINALVNRVEDIDEHLKGVDESLRDVGSELTSARESLKKLARPNRN